MNHNFFVRNKLNCSYYLDVLVYLNEYCNNNKTLNLTQKKKIGEYFNRAINYCTSEKFVKYPKQNWKLDKRILATSKQLVVYAEILDWLNKLIKKAQSDTHLPTKSKRNLLIYLGCLRCHVVGKLNRKINHI